MKNYWRMGDFSIFSVTYAYVDHGLYLADALLVQNKIRMKFKGPFPLCCGYSYVKFKIPKTAK